MGVYDYHQPIVITRDRSEPVTLYEKMPEVTEGNPLKVYVEVTARFTTGGQLIPVSLVWESGKIYAIDRIRSVQRMASRKAGGAGICYTCRILNQDIQLFYEENGLWFVTRKHPVGNPTAE